MRLLAIPNDPTDAYRRTSEEDFLSEFNPETKNGRFFDKVFFLNWRDEKLERYAGIRSSPIVKDKEEIQEVFRKVVNGEVSFDYPMFSEFFHADRKSILDKARRMEPDMIRAFNTHFAAELGTFLKEKLGKPLVVSAHDITRLTDAMHGADKLVCISDALARRCIEEYEIQPSRIAIIPDGINMHLFSPKEKQELEGYEGGNKILSVSRVVPGKNLETLLRAVDLVRNELGDVTHIHVGNGYHQEKEKLSRVKKELQLEGVSHFTGSKPKTVLPHYYSWADVYALPSLHEGLGRSNIEALACGTPVVTSNYAPMTEVVQDGFNGLTVDPRDYEALAGAILKLFKDKELRERTEMNARESVLIKYNADKVMDQYVKLYSELVPST